MTETGPPTSDSAPGSDLPEALVKDRGPRQRRISPVWIIPIVAAVIGAGLAYRAFEQRGIEVTITFETAAGINPGKTTVRLRDVEIGVVKSIRVADDLSNVIVRADLVRDARKHLGKGTQFWVVRPRVSSSGISGLGTLISGAYITMRAAEEQGDPPHHFTGLEEPPLDPAGGGLEIELTSDALHGVNEGSPVYYRGIPVGAVERYSLNEDDSGVVFHVTIEKQYTKLVHENTRFWDTSGIDIKASLSQGFELDVESFRSLIAGGISLETPATPGAPAESGASFELHRHQKAAESGPPKGPRFALEAPRLGSVAIGNAVYYRDEKVGEVVSHGLHDDARSVGIVVAIASRYAPLVRSNTVFWNASGVSADLGLSGLHIHTSSLESLLEGGIAFATPDRAAVRAAAGSVFELQAEVPKNWEKWDPKLPVASAASGSAAPAPEPEEKVHHKDEAKNDPKSTHWFHHLFHREHGS